MNTCWSYQYCERRVIKHHNTPNKNPSPELHFDGYVNWNDISDGIILWSHSLFSRTIFNVEKWTSVDCFWYLTDNGLKLVKVSLLLTAIFRWSQIKLNDNLLKTPPGYSPMWDRLQWVFTQWLFGGHRGLSLVVVGRRVTVPMKGKLW